MNDLMEYGSNGASPTDLVARGDTLQQIRTPYSTAMSVQRQRDIMDVERRVLKEAQMLGEKFYYGWGAGKDRIEGMSIKGAMIIARCWGNCAVEPQPIQETPESWIMSAMFIDLETGFTLGRQFRQSKRWTVHGKHDAERKDDIRFQIGQSKAARNVIANALPEWLVDRAIECAKSGVRANIEKLIASKGIVHAVDKALAEFAKVGVTEEAVLEKLGIAKRSAIETDHLVMLKGDLTAIQTGQERAEDLFPGAEPANARAKKSALSPQNAGGDHRDAAPSLSAIQEQFDACKTAADVDELYDSLKVPEATVEWNDMDSDKIETWRVVAKKRCVK